MGGGKASRYLSSESDGLRKRESTGIEQLPQCLAIEEFGDEEIQPVAVAEVVHRKNVRVVERADCASLALEALHMVGVRGALCTQYLDGDVAAEPGIARTI